MQNNVNWPFGHIHVIQNRCSATVSLNMTLTLTAQHTANLIKHVQIDQIQKNAENIFTNLTPAAFDVPPKKVNFPTALMESRLL